MKLGGHKCSKVTEPNFSGKILIFPKMGKRVQNGLFGLLCKIELLLFARNDLKMMHITQTPYLGKFTFSIFLAKMAQKGQKLGFWSFVEN